MASAMAVCIIIAERQLLGGWRRACVQQLLWQIHELLDHSLHRGTAADAHDSSAVEALAVHLALAGHLLDLRDLRFRQMGPVVCDRSGEMGHVVGLLVG